MNHLNSNRPECGKKQTRMTKSCAGFSRLGAVFFLLFSLLVFQFFLSELSAHASSPKVQISMDTETPYWVGQKIPIYVDLLSPGYFSGTPRFELPEIPGVLMMKDPERPVLGTKDVDGFIFTTQRHEFIMFPQRPGQISVPSFAVRFSVSGKPGEPPRDVLLKTSPLTLTPKMPPGAEKLGVIISTRDLKLSEKWAPAPKDAMTGDAFIRTIIFQAPDIPGMAFPPLPRINIPGAGIYPEAPELNDRMTRGDFFGERVEKVTYVMEKPGEIIIPAISFQWFDIKSETLKSEELPEVSFKVVPSAGNASSENTAIDERLKVILLMIIVLIITAGLVFLR